MSSTGKFQRNSLTLSRYFDRNVHLAMVLANMLVVTLGVGAVGIWWAEVRDAAQLPTMHRAAP